MINKFNKQLLNEITSRNLNSSFEDELMKYSLAINKILAEQGEAPAAPDAGGAAPAPDAGAAAPGGAPAAGGDAAAGGAAGGSEPAGKDIVPNKPYPEILKLIAKALTINLYSETDENNPENDRYIQTLKDFVGVVLEGDKVKKMDKSKALRMLDAVEKAVNNVTGNLNEI